MNRKSRLICIFFFIVCSWSHAVDWMPAPHLEQAVREELEIPDEIPIHPGDMAGLLNLFLREIEHDIRSLKGLEYAVNLKFLVIDRSQVSDLTPLARLENLRVLKLFSNRITDITPLAGLVNLELLILSNNPITDISPLKGLVNLKRLELSGNQIVDFTPNLRACRDRHITSGSGDTDRLRSPSDTESIRPPSCLRYRDNLYFLVLKKIGSFHT